MAFTQIGAMPKNQLDALPLYTASAAATGGSVSIAPGGGIVREWSPTILGINGVNFGPDANGFNILPTTFIDTTGCTKFVAILTRTNAAAGGALANITPCIQYRLTATDVPPTSHGGTQNLNMLGCIVFSNTPVVFAAMTAGGDVQRAAIGWSADIIANAGNPTGADVMLGSNVRVLWNIGSGANPPAGNTFTCTIIGSS